MNSLFGERFLRLFAGDLQGRLKRPISNNNDQKTEALPEDAAEPLDCTFAEGHETSLSEGNQVPNEK